MKKFISLVLVCFLIFTCSAPAFASAAAPENPIVFIAGKGDRLVNADGAQIYPLKKFPDGFYEEQIKEIMPLFLKAVATNNYDAWGNALHDAVYPYYEPIALDADGNPRNGSHTLWTWSRATLATKASGYDLLDYQFHYDWRLDPMDVVDSLRTYIEDVLAVTGKSKVKLIGRCYGGSIVMAYLQKYGSDLVDTTIFYVASTLGAQESSYAFSGKVHIDSDALMRYVVDNVDGGDPLNDFLLAFTQMGSVTKSMDLPAATINLLYKALGDKFMPKMLRATYALLPGIWATVDEDNFDDAKDYIFNGLEEKYTGIVAKTEWYHENVMSQATEILKKFNTDETNPMKVAVITKYEHQTICFLENPDINSDSLVSLNQASFGATAADLECKLKSSYLQSVKDAGLGRYLSADGQVDASTCLFPDYTWFVKDIDHVNWNEQLNTLMLEICRYNGQMTVNSNASYPQFMRYLSDEDTIAPLTEDNSAVEKWQFGFFTSIVRFFRTFFELIKNFLGKGTSLNS